MDKLNKAYKIFSDSFEYCDCCLTGMSFTLPEQCLRLEFHHKTDENTKGEVFFQPNTIGTDFRFHFDGVRVTGRTTIFHQPTKKLSVLPPPSFLNKHLQTTLDDIVALLV